MAKNLSITLFRGWEAKSQYVWSAFVTKLEFRLRLSNISYHAGAGSPRSAPLGKLPYVDIVNGDTTTQIGDSTLIVRHLVEQGVMKPLNTGLDGKTKALDLAMQALMEDKLYFFVVRERWIDNFYVQRDKVLASAPWPVRFVVGNMIYRTCISTLHGQGVGRFPAEEAKEFREDIWTKLNGVLEDARRKSVEGNCFWCLGGENPTDCDTTIFGFIATTLMAESSPESTAYIKKLPAIMDYATRIHDEYFPDYEKWAIA